MSQPPVRPPQATLCGLVVIFGSVAAVVYAFFWMDSIGSMGFQDRAATFLRDDPVRSASWTVDDVQRLARVLGFVTGGAAATCAVLGVSVLGRSRSARIVLSIIAPVLLLGGFVVATVPTIGVLAAVVALWFQPTSGWLATAGTPEVLGGERSATRTGPARSELSPPVAPPITPPAPRSDPVAPPGPDGGSGTDSSSAGPTPWPPAWSAYDTSWPPARETLRPTAYDLRPGQVVAACVTTWVASALIAAVAVLAALAIAVSPDEVARQAGPELSRAGVSLHRLAIAIYVFAGVAVVWGLAASLFAWAAFRRAPWGRSALLVCSALVVAVSLAAMWLQPFAVVTLGAGVATLVLLQREPVRRWFGPQAP